MLNQNRDFTLASEKWTAIQYRQEIEGVLRTPDYAGFQLLHLNDFTGQGDALVGLLEPFWNPKGDLSPEYFRQFCAPTVPLLRFEKYTWTSSETFKAQALVSHFGPRDLKDVKLCWQLNGPPLRPVSMKREENSAHRALPSGGLTSWGEFEIPLGFATKTADVYHLTLSLFPASGNQPPLASNTWTLWIYPEIPEPKPFDNVLVLRHYDENTLRALAEGKRVVLIPLNARNDNAYAGNFYSVYWSAKFFPAPDASSASGAIPAIPRFRDSHRLAYRLAMAIARGRLKNLPARCGPIRLPPHRSGCPRFPSQPQIGLSLRNTRRRGTPSGLRVECPGRYPPARHFYASILRYAAPPLLRPKPRSSPNC
jgi:hypothetical protein